MNRLKATSASVDDASRIASPRSWPSAVAFLEASLAYYASLGVTVQRVTTDNGSCYRSQAFREACRPTAHPHAAVHAEDQRQDRAPRMGLRAGLEPSDRRAEELPIRCTALAPPTC